MTSDYQRERAENAARDFLAAFPAMASAPESMRVAMLEAFIMGRESKEARIDSLFMSLAHANMRFHDIQGANVLWRYKAEGGFWLQNPKLGMPIPLPGLPLQRAVFEDYEPPAQPTKGQS